MTRDQIGQARRLIAELSCLLDQLEGDERQGRAAKALKPPRTPAPERKSSPETVDTVRRQLRRMGVRA